MGRDWARRSVNAEEAVIPLRTFVLILWVAIIAVISGAAVVVGVAWTARGRWDDTQTAISDLKLEVEKTGALLTEAVVTFNKTVVDKGKARDDQLKAIGDQFGEVNGRIDTLQKTVTDLADAQDSAHDETMKRIASVESTAANAGRQAQAAAESIAHFKCVVRPKDCQPAP